MTRVSVLLGLALVLVAVSVSFSFANPQSTAATLALAVLAAVALGVVRPRHGAGLAPTTASRRALRRHRLTALTPSRQCDPDAAGHPRPRAPGRG